MSETSTAAKRPWGLKWRSSVWYVTFVVGLGITVDLLVYSIIIPVLPFQLEHLGYQHVSSLTGWLLFAYSAGLVVFTPPIAALSEHYGDRKWPLLLGQLCLAGSQVMLMEVPTYWLMTIARVIQGISSSVVWVIGLALICDTVPSTAVGKYLGIAMTGLSLGFLVGPPVGGALFNTFGFRGPFIFAIIVTMIDFLGRLLIIERKDALRWGIDPAAITGVASGAEQEKNEATQGAAVSESPHNDTARCTTATPVQDQEEINTPKRLSMLQVVATLLKSPRALVTVGITLIQGLVYSTTEPTLPLHLQEIWNLTSSKVGLIYMAVVLPTLISSPLAGWLSDRGGTEWVAMSCLLLSIPWWAIQIIQKSLPLFIVAIALQSFFTAAILSPITTELAAVSRAHAGIGYAHVYGAFNLCYGIGSGLGPVIGGQIYDHVPKGWMAICLLAAGLILLGSALSFGFIGNRPLLSRLVSRYRERKIFKLKHNTPVTPATSNEVN